MTQLSFSSLEFSGKKKQTKRDVFLAEMSSAVPWDLLVAQIEPYHPKTELQRLPRRCSLARFRRAVRASA